MVADQRQLRIVEILAERGECSVESLASMLRVSEMTVRRDLGTLAAAGRVLRTHGGAAPADRASFNFQFLSRTQEYHAAKRAIAKVAAGYVKNGFSVMLDSGTTTLALARELKAKKNLTIITTSLPIAAELQFCDNIQVLLLGGFVQRNAPDLGGRLTETNLESLHADITFIGADGIDLRGSIYNHSFAVGNMLCRMAGSASRVFVVADHSKIGRTALNRFGHVSRWNGLITDSVDTKQAAALRRARVHLIQARRRRRKAR